MWLGRGLADPYHEGTNLEETGRQERNHRYSREVWGESERETEAQSLHAVASERCQELIYTTSKGHLKGSVELPLPTSRACGRRAVGSVVTTR